MSLFFTDATAFRAWLAANAASAAELLVVYRKVSSGQPNMSWSESVDEALCFGWIDGRRQRIDEHSYSIRFTPRKPVSIWSDINIAKVQRLRAEGKMTPAGEQAYALRSVARSGVYYHEQDEAAELTADELGEFKRHAPAWTFFDATPPGYRKRITHWIVSARKAETRAARLVKLIQASAEGVRLP